MIVLAAVAVMLTVSVFGQAHIEEPFAHPYFRPKWHESKKVHPMRSGRVSVASFGSDEGRHVPASVAMPASLSLSLRQH